MPVLKDNGIEGRVTTEGVFVPWLCTAPKGLTTFSAPKKLSVASERSVC